MKRRTIAAIVTSGAAVGILALAGTGMVSAESQDQSSLVDKIASHFNLNKTDVQKVVDDFKTEHQAERDSRYQDRLQKAVDQGQLTAEQKDKILAKHKELEDFRASLKDKTPEQRHDAMKNKHDELKKWADDNNIPLRFLLPVGGPGHNHGPDA
jgi:polyhydroxyalkanoate synthesis regulator phasin